MHCFILAGGFATRLWPLTEKRAKPLLPLLGRPIIDHLVDNVPANIPITVSTNAAFGEDFVEWAKTTGRDDISVVVEQTESDKDKLGALGAVAQWIRLHNIDEDILLLTGDNYCGFTFEDFLESAEQDKALVAGYDIQSKKEASQFGTIVLSSDKKTVKEFEEKPKDPKSTLVSTGCSILPKKTLPILLEYAKEHPDNVGGIFEELLNKGETVQCFTFTDPWEDIGSFHAYLESTKRLVGKKVVEEDGAKCRETETHGSVVIGKNSHVHNCKLENVVIFENCHIEDCHLRDCIIDDDCHLKGVDLTEKMIGKGTTLGK